MENASEDSFRRPQLTDLANRGSAGLNIFGTRRIACEHADDSDEVFFVALAVIPELNLNSRLPVECCESQA